MKKTLLLFLLLIAAFTYAQQQTVTASITPSSFNASDEITISFDGSSINESTWGITDHALYLWSWSFDLNDENIQDSPTNGDWTNSNESNKLAYDSSSDTYSISFIPTSFYNRTSIGRIGFLIKAKDGSGDKKSQDIISEVGSFEVTITSPLEETTIINSGSDFNISATSSVTADFELVANGNTINTQNSITDFSYNYSVTENTDFELVITETGTSNVLNYYFNAIVTPSPTEAPVPAGMEDGFNYDSTNPNQATFVLYAPNKEFVHLIGNFNGNDWTIDNTYLLNKDSATDRHWITLDLSSNTENDLLYQYLVEYGIQIADPYSTLVLDEYNDSYIEENVFPDIPNYPFGKTSQMVSWVQLDEEVYEWQTADFTPPAKEDLVVYEILLRDFDEDHSFQNIIDRLDYLQDLGINAIELMPVQEFDGNISWGYNPAFHMALDKYYGTRNALKTLIDVCHSQGIAVILDVVYNHATGQNPYYRMYNTDNGGTGGFPSSDSPFFNETATHSYSVFNDFNHQSDATKSYVERTSTYWINEFNIDGFRWDLTKGFTQNCTDNESCTNAYNADRVAVLEEYADMQWALDEDFYVIFEHLGNGGSATEEIEWSNYRADEGKGIMLWNKQTDLYNEATMGYADANINGISYLQKGFSVPAAVGYMESHDEERLMYKNLEFGNSNSTYNVKDIPTALERMQAAGAFFFTVPGPKMIWQFGELGYDTSIFTCENGTVNNDCKLSPKPDGWDFLDDADRMAINETWSKLIALKLNEPIFKTSDFIIDATNSNGLKKIQLTDPNASGDAIKYITILGNFGIVAQNINPQFQETGTWYNLMDGSTLEVGDTSATINLAPGAFKIFANESTNLSIDALNKSSIKLYPNPAQNTFRFNKQVDRFEIYNLSGQLIQGSDSIQINHPIDISKLSPGLYLVKTFISSKLDIIKLIVE